MTQMVAHDVRKPFSLVKSAMSILSHANSIDDVRMSMKVIGPSVEKALVSVNGMLDDIMEIGRVEKPSSEPTSLVAIIDASISEVFQIHQDAKIALRYSLAHTHAVEVEFTKIQRMMSNIVGNAVQAMQRRGEIWFTSSENNKVVEVRVGNSGPIIPEEDLPKLFEAFYSKGKKGGTGLGLAIAKKVIVAHGGDIRCQYTADRKFVEFVFTLPIADKLEDGKTTTLPNNSNDVVSVIAPLAATQSAIDSAVVSDPREIEFENRIIDAAKNLGRPLVVAVVDDEPLYRAAIHGLVGKKPGLIESFKVELYDKSSDILNSLCGDSHPDCVVCDIDLDTADPMDGFDVVSELRRLGFAGPICIHSNRSSVEDSQRGFSSGADLILPKPMSRAHLLGFIASSCSKAEVLEPTTSIEVISKPVVVVVDDDSLVLLGWEMDIGSEVEIVTFDTVHAVVEQMASNEVFCSRVVCVISDFWFGKENVLDVGLVAKLREARYEGPILLSSSIGNEHNVSSFTAVIPKRPMEWARVRELIPMPRASD
jgi:DNA-binding response OmpR family regulator